MNKSFVMLATIFLLLADFFPGYAQEEEIVFSHQPKGPLGVLLTDVAGEKLQNLGLKGGAEIKKIFENSEAEKKGLQEKDIIIAVDGNEIAAPDDLAEKIFGIEEEKDVALTYYRDGNKKTVTVHIKPVAGDFLFDFDDEEFSICLPHGSLGTGSCVLEHFGDDCGKGGYLGIEAKNLSEQMQDYFEVKQGVLIENVTKESPAEKAGFKAGDVILSINKREIKDYGDLVRTLNYYNPDEKITVEISRKGSKKNVDVVLGEKKQMPVHKRIEKMVPGDKKIKKRIKIQTGEGSREELRIRYLMI
jgi:C-terminal processing protease CtpA/Prc